MDRDKLHNFTKVSPSNVTSLEGLIPYGKYHRQDFKDRLDNNDHFFVDIINPSEHKSIKRGLDTDWKYYINKYNFRDPWTTDKKTNIGFFGCSFTFGEGISSENTFVQKVTKEINCNGFNFGVGGAGIERVARTFSAATKVINFDYAVVTLPSPNRQLYYSSNFELANIVQSYVEDEYKKLGRSLAMIQDEYFYSISVSFINWIVDIAQTKNIKLILSSWDHPTNEMCSHLFPNNTVQPFPNIDDKQARDMQHPGNKSQQAHAEQILKALNDKTRFS